MQEYLMLIHTDGDYCARMPGDIYKEHLEKVGKYIERLSLEGKLIKAQPLEMKGILVHGNKGVFKDGPFVETKEVIIGYYIVRAENLEEARKIAMENPVFEDASARMEIRPIKTKENNF